MSLKNFVFREGRGNRKWELFFFLFHQIGTADSLIEHLTAILFWSQNNLIHKWAEKNPADTIWYKTFQRQLYIESESSLNCFFYQLPLMQTDFSSTIVILADLNKEPEMTLYVCYSMGKKPLCCPLIHKANILTAEKHFFFFFVKLSL